MIIYGDVKQIKKATEYSVAFGKNYSG